MISAKLARGKTFLVPIMKLYLILLASKGNVCIFILKYETITSELVSKFYILYFDQRI